MNRYLTAITTYGTPAYVHLGLEHFRRHSAGLTDVIVCDDHSGNEKLKEVCDSYGADLLSTPYRAQAPDIGDMRLMMLGLERAKETGCTHFLKLSRSMILKRSPFPGLDWLIEQSGGWTFTNRETRADWGFKTCLDCYDVDAWWRLIPEMRAKLEEWGDVRLDFRPIRVEPYIHTLARREQPTSEKYLRWVEMHPCCPEDNGYVHWDWIGDNWQRCPDHIMWYSYAGPADYCAEAHRVGLSEYTENDFRR